MDEEVGRKRLKERQGSIFPIYEAFYIQSMLFNARAAMASLSEIAELSTSDIKNGAPSARLLLQSMQTLMLHAGALSRFFWPSRTKLHEARGEELRRAFNIKDDSPLADRSLRDAMEHFDERLDIYLCGDPIGYVFPEYVGPLAFEGDAGHFFRAYDPEAMVFEMLGARHEVQPIAHEIMRINTTLLRMAETGWF